MYEDSPSKSRNLSFQIGSGSSEQVNDDSRKVQSKEKKETTENDVDNNQSNDRRDNKNIDSNNKSPTIEKALPPPIHSSPELSDSNNSSSTKLDNAILSNLNKSLKAKQRVINTKEPHPKNSTVITDIINRSPQTSTFPPNNLPTTTTSTGPQSNPSVNDLPDNISSFQLTDPAKSTGKASKSKKVSKQNSTKTDFFAAKLASAVDDVDSSDSDETFVYENNANDDYNDEASNSNNNTVINPSIRDDITRESDSPKVNDTTNDTHVNNVLPHNQVNGEDPNDNDTKNSDVDNSHNNENNSNNNEITNNSKSNTTTKTDNESITNVDPSSLTNSPGFGRFNKPESLNLASASKLSNVPDSSKASGIKSPFPINTINNNNRPMINSSVNSSFGNSNQFLEGLVKHNYRPSNQRTSSFNSVSTNNDEPQTNSNTLNVNNSDGKYQSRSSSPFNQSVYSTTTQQSSKQPTTNTGSNKYYYNAEDDSMDENANDANETNADDNIDDVDDDSDADEADDYSSRASYNSQKNFQSSSNTTVPVNNKSNLIKGGEKETSQEPTNASIISKGTSSKKRPGSSSSKLRSTTSKLFDKKGAQPRRYSIIPDDIDIEDFDDELIYYDNNVRFPINSNSLNFNENSPLVSGGGHKLPHYRSLNLNLPNHKRQPSKNKRYLSVDNTQPNSPSGNNMNSDIFPFPYPEQNQNYYYGLDEYDEENSIDDRVPFHKPIRKTSSRFNNPHLSPNNNHFILPRKKSFGYQHYNYLKRTIYTLISILGILTIGFILGFVMATTKDLASVQISDIQNPLISQDELVFNVVVEAFNPGWFTVGIEEVELDIFAKSGYLPTTENLLDPETSEERSQNTVETVLLGSIYTLESAIYFPGGFFNREPIQQVGEIKLLSPGNNLTNFDTLAATNNSTEPDNSEKWEVISKNPFDLIIRGILKYNLPMSKSTKSVVVTKTSYVDPNMD